VPGHTAGLKSRRNNIDATSPQRTCTAYGKVECISNANFEKHRRLKEMEEMDAGACQKPDHALKNFWAIHDHQSTTVIFG
jgi:hypothetical protein